MLACPAAFILFPSNFADLFKLLKQTAALSTDIDASWLNLLLAFQGDAIVAAHTARFRVLANLTGAPEGSLARLYRASLPDASQLSLAALSHGATLAKEVEA